MKAAELRQKGQKELQRELQREKERLGQLRFDLSSGKIKNMHEIKATKKNIARILTILKSKV